MARLNVFLSHLTIEKQLAEVLQQAVTRDFIGLIEFFVSSDTTSIPVGEKWLDKIVDALARSDLHLVLCSPEAVKRPWINFETGAARQRGTRIVPICHSGLSPKQLPVPLSEFEPVQASDREDLLKLYKHIASVLGSGVPDARLDELVTDIRAFETEYQGKSALAAACEIATTSVGVIVSPRVLCVSSEQFQRLLRFSDFQIIQEAFPDTVTHVQKFTSAEVRKVLTEAHFDIVHVATYVCPKTGDLVFSEVDTNTGEKICQPDDFLTAEAFASLLKDSRTSLAVIATCESFELAAALLEVTNVVATRDIIAPKMFATWVENFYGLLPNQTLSQAFDYAVKASRAPMKLYAKQDLQMKSVIKRTSTTA